MIALESKVEGIVTEYDALQPLMQQHRFVVGGNWDYEKGSFDRRLDGEKQTVWLRVPFEVVHGRFDAEQPEPATRVRLMKPYVLGHVYNTGDDHDAHFATYGALVNQFQTPTDADAPVEQRYMEEAARILRELEAAI